MEAMGPSTTLMVTTVTKEDDDHDHDHVLEQLPPGFRFHPTDEELIIHYLLNKVINNSFTARAIAQADFNKCEPWDLPKLAKMGENEWFFFCQRDRKYPTGIRTNRATQSGYWKATGKDREIHTLKPIKHDKCLVGMKKTLVFYKGRAPKGDKTNWVMHEYRLEGNFPSYNFSRAAKDSWVICKVFHKNTAVKRSSTPGVDHINNTKGLPPLVDYSGVGCSLQSPFSSASYEPEFKYNISELQNPIFFSHVSPYNNQACYQDYQYGMGTAASNIENFSSNNSVVSHSQDTGISNEINSVHFEECKKPFEYNDYQDEDNVIEGLTFGPNSDLDSFWRF